MTCHSPHSSDEMALLTKKPIDVCLQCHPDTPHGSHISKRPQEKNEQTKGASGETEPQDPNRPGKPFYCGSCHDPHSTDGPLLYRFNAQSMQELCVHCHKMN
jgi:predicted CXXCH cytochrome family protein